MLLLIPCHLAAVVVIFLLGLALSRIYDGYLALSVWLYGGAGFFLLQLIYVIPLSLWLKRQGKTGLMQGVILGAVLTALINGTCSLSLMH